MAIQTGMTSAAEHDWFATRSGLTSGTLNEHKAKYFSDEGFGGANVPLSQMERTWLQAVASSTSNNEGDLWREACAAQSIPVTQNTSENRRNFFLGVAGSPPA